jgi:hypothetical protein
MPIDAWLFAGHPLEPMNETSHFAEAFSSVPATASALVSYQGDSGDPVYCPQAAKVVRRRPHEDGRRYAVQAWDGHREPLEHRCPSPADREH